MAIARKYYRFRKHIWDLAGSKWGPWLSVSFSHLTLAIHSSKIYRFQLGLPPTATPRPCLFPASFAVWTVSLAPNTSKSVPNTFCDTHTSAGDLTGVRNTVCGVSACENGQMRVSHAHCVRVGSSAVLCGTNVKRN